MLKIGITGGIASGKTVASKFFKEKDEAFIFNADQISKKHLKKSKNLQKKIIHVFGEDIVIKKNIDLKLLSKKAFKNKINHKILNGIMWPEIYMLINKSYEKEKKNGKKIFVVDAALIFEANFQNFFDKIILVTAKKEIRIKRAIKRKNIPLESIQNRISLQMTDAEKRKIADYTITNDSDIIKFQNSLEKIYLQLF